MCAFLAYSAALRLVDWSLSPKQTLVQANCDWIKDYDVDVGALYLRRPKLKWHVSTCKLAYIHMCHSKIRKSIYILTHSQHTHTLLLHGLGTVSFFRQGYGEGEVLLACLHSDTEGRNPSPHACAPVTWSGDTGQRLPLLSLSLSSSPRLQG